MQAFPIIKFMYNNIYSDSKKGNMETTHEIITRLKFIGLVKKGEKISVKNMSVQPTTLATSFWRMFNQESRDTTLDFLTSTVNRAFEIIHLGLTSNKGSDTTMCKNLIEDLINCTTGLLNIQNTYNEDRLFWCHIQTLIQGIEVRLSEIKEKREDLFVKEKEDRQKEEKKDDNKPIDREDKREKNNKIISKDNY